MFILFGEFYSILTRFDIIIFNGFCFVQICLVCIVLKYGEEEQVEGVLRFFIVVQSCFFLVYYVWVIYIFGIVDGYSLGFYWVGGGVFFDFDLFFGRKLFDFVRFYEGCFSDFVLFVR